MSIKKFENFDSNENDPNLDKVIKMKEKYDQLKKGYVNDCDACKEIMRMSTGGYEIGVYVNNPTTSQIGGGYGASGITTIKHTQLLGSSENYCRNKRVISKLCKFIKKYVEENL